MKTTSVPLGPRTSFSVWVLPSTPLSEKPGAFQPKLQTGGWVSAMDRASVVAERQEGSDSSSVIEADRDALAAGAVERHFVAQPALPEEERARLRFQIDEGLVVAGGAGFARRGRHHQAEGRVFQLERAGAGRHGHVIGAADHALGVNVRGVNTAALHHVEPERVELQRATAQLEVEGAGERRNVGVEMADETGKGGRALREILA